MDRAKNKPGTNWKKLKAIKDEEIDTSDIPPLDESFFKNAKLRMPKNKVANNICLDMKSKSL